jgi:glycosyltransferase involved in cell wall biosynthesis
LSNYDSYEIIVVDDCSTDDTVALVHQKGITVYQLPEKAGPAAARNYGAERSQGEILLFIDSDVEVREETIALVVEDFRQHPETAAVFGSYDDTPAETNFLSQYRNLFHHFHHQQADAKAFSFWAGCGAVRKNVFKEIEGFDQKRYNTHSIEDIELGYRICERGYRIALDKNLWVKHLKRWEFVQMIHTDIFLRAVPWSHLILELAWLPKDLNLKLHHKVSSVLVAMLVCFIPFAVLMCVIFPNANILLPCGMFLALVICFLYLNRKMYAFFRRKRGALFMIKVIPLHLLYYFYSGASFVFCWTIHKFTRFQVLYHIFTTP